MSDLFPEDTMKILGCQAAFVIVPLIFLLVSIGIVIGWMIWG